VTNLQLIGLECLGLSVLRVFTVIPTYFVVYWCRLTLNGSHFGKWPPQPPHWCSAESQAGRQADSDILAPRLAHPVCSGVVRPRKVGQLPRPRVSSRLPLVWLQGVYNSWKSTGI